jgi:transcription elongation factor GreA
MQVPTRKYDKIPKQKSDPHITEDKFNELLAKKDHLIKVKRPKEAAEVQRLALMGDFSENAGYQLAKSRLRGINNKILEIDDLLNRAEIIKTNPSNNQVELGNTVTIENNGKQKSYLILGSAETNPEKGIISHNSPLGAALLGKTKNDIVEISLNGKSIYWKIIDIK